MENPIPTNWYGLTFVWSVNCSGLTCKLWNLLRKYQNMWTVLKQTRIFWIVLYRKINFKHKPPFIVAPTYICHFFCSSVRPSAGPSRTIFQESYITWPLFLEHVCKMMISRGIFFIFKNFWFFGLIGGEGGG